VKLSLKHNYRCVCFSPIAGAIELNDLKVPYKVDLKLTTDLTQFQDRISQLISNQKLESAMEVYQEMLSAGNDPNVNIMNLLIKGFFNDQNYVRVMQLYEALNIYQLEMNEETLILLVDAFLACNNLLEAEKVFYKYKKTSEFAKIPLSVYRSLIFAFGERRKVEEAYDLVKMVRNQDETPTLEMYNSIIQAAAKLRNTSVTWRCLLDLKDLNIQWNIDSWNGFIGALCNSNKLDEALKQFYQLESQNKVSPNSETYSILIIAMAKDKRILPVENLFVQMRNKGLVVPDNLWRYVIEGFARSKQLEKAFILVDQMMHEGVVPKGPILNILHRQCERKGKMELYIERFGAPNYTTVSRKENLQMRDSLLSNLDTVNWDLEGDPFSIMTERNKKKEIEEQKYQSRLRKLEEDFLDKIPGEFRMEMEKNQQKLATKKREKTTLTKSSNPPKKTIKLRKKPEPKPNPFDALDALRNVKKKRRTTQKDTRRPRSQFLTGRHMGPKK
jgi:pentatricopeptide repeat protein